MFLAASCRLLRWHVRPRVVPAGSCRRALCSSDIQHSHSQSRPLHAHSGPFSNRTHHCGALRAADADSRVVLAGWLLPQRKIANTVSFFSIRDSHGTTQLVVTGNNLEESENVLKALSEVPVESVVLVKGLVRSRPKRAQRKDDPTGDIEVLVDSFTLLNTADHQNMPFLAHDRDNLPSEELRARFRFLDLRRRPMTHNLQKRSRVMHLLRNALHEQDFVEIETPILLKSTPEGAREFLVPTRIQGPKKPGEYSVEPLFYALSQSPQQPKQLLMCSGTVDKYYQIARCFRDEDGRKDRQPEFTQLDLEMAFVSWGNESERSLQEFQDLTPNLSALSENVWRIGGCEVRSVVETIVRRIWKEIEGVELAPQFGVMTYRDAMSRFGSDKPDTRFGLEIVNLTPLLPHDIREQIASRNEIVECLVVRRSENPAFVKSSRACSSESNDLAEHIRITNANFPSWLQSSNVVKNAIPDPTLLACMEESHTRGIAQILHITTGDSIWLSRRRSNPEGGSTELGRLRLRLAQMAESLDLYKPPNEPHFLWVTEFPLFTRTDKEKDFVAKGRWSSTHHPFTAPMWEDVAKLQAGEIEMVRGQHYDLVVNGIEIGGGSVRVHDPAMQEYILSSVLQLTANEMASFGHLLHALKCGAPPHGGIALGLDRLMSVLCNTPTIRDVIAFPKTGAGTDTFFKSPSAVNKETLTQYGIMAR